ncbi:MAG: DNA-protecting protein DprA [Bacteroidetes bacterium HGW-Bacteroidetes-20]|nr:MAG: DNA-protecting protein DprA [Bacteroidetes bacterium HGW-Bacteroidetes-20]
MLNELYYRLALNFIPHLSNFNIKKLIQYYESAAEVFNPNNKKPHISNKVTFKHPFPKIDNNIDGLVRKELEIIQKKSIQVCFFDQSEYPTRLKSCSNAPNIFFYKGDGVFNHSKMLSIIGTRNASSYGADVVHKIISEIASDDIVIVSGLASGIDTLAHEAALHYGLKTIGVMGSGFSRVYPDSNIKLVKKMIESGSTVMTEYNYDVKPDRVNFPIRNRIIASISDATLVVESKNKGGSIITAEMAHTFNRDVFAIPGSIFDENQEGCHELIAQKKASIITSGEEMLKKMGWNSTQPQWVQPKLFYDFSEEEEFVYKLLKSIPQMTIDELVALCPLFTPSKIASILLSLEFNGIIECKPGKVYRLIRK